MKNSEIIKILNKHRGPIYIGVLGKDCVVYFEISRASVVRRLKDMSDDHETFTAEYLNGELFIDCAF